MTMQLGSIAPDFTADSTQGVLSFHEWAGDSWVLLFAHPKDFTPVCTTEVGSLAGLAHEFHRRNCKVIGVSVDPVDDHLRWSDDILRSQGHAVSFPLVGDPTLEVAKRFGLLPADAAGAAERRTAADNATARSVMVIAPDKTVKAVMTYPMTTGRNFAEILRVLDSVQLTASHQVATPANWNQGDDVIIVPSVSDEEAAHRYPEGWDAPLPYLRLIGQPSSPVPA